MNEVYDLCVKVRPILKWNVHCLKISTKLSGSANCVLNVNNPYMLKRFYNLFSSRLWLLLATMVVSSRRRYRKYRKYPKKIFCWSSVIFFPVQSTRLWKTIESFQLWLTGSQSFSKGFVPCSVIVRHLRIFPSKACLYHAWPEKGIAI